MAATAAERAKAYRARKAAAAGKAAAFTTVVECLWCGSAVGGKRPDAIFCSDACAKASNRKVKRTDYEGGSTAAVEAAEAKLAEALTTAWEVFGWGDGKAFTVEGWMSGTDPDEEWFWAKFVDGGGPADANETDWLAVVKEAAAAVSVARRSAAGFKSYAAAVKRAAAAASKAAVAPGEV